MQVCKYKVGKPQSPPSRVSHLNHSIALKSEFLKSQSIFFKKSKPKLTSSPVRSRMITEPALIQTFQTMDYLNVVAQKIRFPTLSTDYRYHTGGFSGSRTLEDSHDSPLKYRRLCSNKKTPVSGSVFVKAFKIKKSLHRQRISIDGPIKDSPSKLIHLPKKKHSAYMRESWFPSGPWDGDDTYSRLPGRP